MTEVVLGTPSYVLMDGSRRISPDVLTPHSEIECSPIDGFSAKGLYDRFSLKGELALTPYPLVKGYLRNQVDSPGDSLKLVVLDAAGPHEPCLHASTMEAVLEAQENRASQLTPGYRLMFDQQTTAYAVEQSL